MALPRGPPRGRRGGAQTRCESRFSGATYRNGHEYDRPLEHLSGQLDIAPLKLPLRARDERYGLVLCFSLEVVDPTKLARELVRVAHPDGTIWVVVWKKDHLPLGVLSWDEAQRVMLTTSWVDNKILSLGEQVYATRYVRRRRPAKV